MISQQTPELDLTACYARQDRLRSALAQAGQQAALLSNPKSLLYCFNLKLPVEFSAFALLPVEGEARLLTPMTHNRLACKQVHLVDIRDQGGPRNERHALLRRALREMLIEIPQPASLAVEAEFINLATIELIEQVWSGCQLKDCGDLLRGLRRHKDADEIELIRAAVKVIEAGYAAVPDLLRHAKTEVDVHAGMAAAGSAAVGTSIWLEGDFASGQRGVSTGGPPFDVALQSGDFYILDVFPRVHGYGADLSRTAVLGTPTTDQFELWRTVRDVLIQAQERIRPGVACRAVQEFMVQGLSVHAAGSSYWHHGGHGIGLDPHESPRITATSNDVFEVGDVFTLEPGLYQSDLGGGVRLEENYLVTQTGVERLSSFPLDLLLPSP